MLLLLALLPGSFLAQVNLDKPFEGKTKPPASWTIRMDPQHLSGHLDSLFNKLRQADIGLNPDITDSLELQLGFGLYLSKQYDLAREYFNRIQPPGNPAQARRSLWAQMGLALVAYDLLDHEKALSLLQSCRDALEKQPILPDPLLEFHVYHYLSLVNLNLGNLSEADVQLVKAIELAPENELPGVNNERVRILAQLGHSEEAMDLAVRNLGLYKKQGNPLGICIGHTTVGAVALNLGNNELAVRHWDSCLTVARQRGVHEAAIWISRMLSGYYKRKGNAELALQYLEYNSAYKDSMTGVNNRIQMALEMARSRTAQKQQEILILAGEKEQMELGLQKNRILLVSIVLATGLLVLAIILLRYRSREREHQLRLELNRIRLNPHFIFNSLNSLQKSIISGDFETSNRYLTRFSGLMRETLDQSLEPFIPLSRERDFLVNYLSLEQMRFNNRFSFAIETASDIIEETVFLPGMMLQPILENAIWHGLIPVDREGFIRVTFCWKKPGRLLVCSVEDNGIGRTAAQALKAGNSGPFTSRSNDILKTRIDLMCKLYHKGTSVTWTDILDSSGQVTGTRVQLVLPVKTDPS